MTNQFFFDSYAFFEIIKGNPEYGKYINSKPITTKINLFELYHGLLKRFDEETGINYLNKYFPFVIEFDKDIIITAANFKYLNKKRNLSMVDCIGYALSNKLGIKFLTGDKEFEDLPNVEFVK